LLINHQAIRKMAHLGRAEGYEQEISSDDGLDIINTTRKSLPKADIDKYIKGKS
jgi:hypothetical protein